MKIKIVLLLLLVLTAFALVPTGKVTGVVTNHVMQPLANVTVSVKGTKFSTKTDSLGRYAINVSLYAKTLIFSIAGYQTKEVSFTAGKPLNVSLSIYEEALAEMEAAPQEDVYSISSGYVAMSPTMMSRRTWEQPLPQQNTENYKAISETGFQIASQQPVTTFSVDVDRAAYSNVRRFLTAGEMPPIDAVRIEEMINYFDYDYPQPTGKHPLSVSTELTDSPWNAGLKLLHIGLQAKTVPTENLPSSNLVFLIDVSGSMSDHNKLPLLKQAFKLLVDQLRPQDKISIVVYAGAAGEVLAPTSGSNKSKIREALENLDAGGSTAGGEGINLAYHIAKENFIENGNNRIILATDGDFNVGVSSESDLQRLIEEKRKTGIFLSVMGFGIGNYKDSQIETLADKGNGNYAYIDNIQEAQKEFVQEFGGTLFTIAKDVKLQIEFNPQHVQAYRLIGYENRTLKNEEFHDDAKDAGEMGSGHTVTALYEIVPAGMKHDYLAKTDALKYQNTKPSDQAKTDELLTLKIRYKKPDADESILFDTTVKNVSKPMNACSENLRFASAVAEFGLLVRNSEFKGLSNYQHAITRAKSAFGKDEEGYRSEFVRLVKTAQSLDGANQTASKD